MFYEIILILLIYNSNCVLSYNQPAQTNSYNNTENHTTNIDSINLSLEYFSYKNINMFVMAVCINKKGV